MGDVRFAAPYRYVKDAADRARAMRGMDDESLIGALAGAAVEGDAFLVNVLASQAQNRARRKQTILQTLGEGVFEVDAHGRLRFLNPAAEELLGWTFDELNGQFMHDVLHAWSPGRHRSGERCRLEETLGSTDVTSVEETFSCKDGGDFPVAFTAAPTLRDGEPDGTVVVFRDITERKRAEEELREARVLLEAVIEGAEDPVWVKDRQRRFVLINGAGARFIGRPVKEFLGKTIQEVIGQAPDPRIEQEDEEVIARGETRTSDVSVMVAGEPRTFLSMKWPWRDAHGKVVGLIGISRDITERHRAAEALRESERRLRTVVSHAPVILTIVDREGIVTFSEGRALDALGMERGSVGRSVFEAYAHNPGVTENVRAALAGEERRALVEEQGNSFDIRWTPIRSPDGEVAEVLAVTVDVTTLKLAERERAQILVREQAARAEMEKARLAEEHAARISALAEASRAFAEATLDLQTALHRVARTVVGLIGDGCVIRLLSEDGEQLVPAAIHHHDPARLDAMRRAFLAAPLSTKEGVHVRLVQNLEQVTVDLTSEELRRALPAEQVQALTALGVKAFLVAPLRLKDRVIGSIGFSRESDRPFTPDDSAFLQDLADRAALAIENARLHQAEREARLQAQKAADAIEALAREFARASAEVLGAQPEDFEATEPP
jgi:PAS domain S-box-containing protein